MSSIELSFEIYFVAAEELTGLLEEVARALERPGSRTVLGVSSLVYGDENVLLRISYEEPVQGVQAPLLRGLSRAVGRISCLEPVRCVEVYQVVHEIAKNRRVRIRVL